MNNRKECPNCGAFDTERVHVEWMADRVEEVRICNECPCQYTNSFGDMLVDYEHPQEWQGGEA